MAVAEREITQPFYSQTSVPQTYRWTCEQFHTMGEEGRFQGQRVILMEGEIIAMPSSRFPRRRTRLPTKTL